MRWHFKANVGRAIPPYELIKFGLQYQRILSELRNEGMQIFKVKDITVNGQRQTAYQYNPDNQGRLF